MIQKQTLEVIRQVSAFAGVIVTLAGIGVSFSANVVGGCISTFGVVLTCVGLWAERLLSKHQEAEKTANDARLEELEYRLSESEEITNHPAIADALGDWAVEHQDDGR